MTRWNLAAQQGAHQEVAAAQSVALAPDQPRLDAGRGIPKDIGKSPVPADQSGAVCRLCGCGVNARSQRRQLLALANLRHSPEGFELIGSPRLMPPAARRSSEPPAASILAAGSQRLRKTLEGSIPEGPSTNI